MCKYKLYAPNAKEIEPAATKRRGLGVETDSASTGSKINIADFLDDVKSYYSDVLSDCVRIIPMRVWIRTKEVTPRQNSRGPPLFIDITSTINIVTQHSKNVNSQDHPHACEDKCK